MCSGRSENDLERHSSVMCGINTVADHYDKITNVLIRATHIKAIDSINDKKTLIQVLRTIKPFKKVTRRQHVGIGIIPESGYYVDLNVIQFKEWLTCKQRIYSMEIGK